MHDYELEISGTSGSPVLLLPGGAASSRGFFPGLVEALAAHRVISLDRPGTGLAQHLGDATLGSGSRAAADAISNLGAGPAVVVGQSLGGAQAVEVAVDHPDLVAGLVLIDPTPLDLRGVQRTAQRAFTVLGLPGRVPVMGRLFDHAIWRLLGRKNVAPEARDAFDVMVTSASLAQTARAISTFVEDAAALVPRLRSLDMPVVVLTADRPTGHAVRRSHERLAAALGGRLVTPPGAVHAQHLRDPKAVNALILEVVAEAAART